MAFPISPSIGDTYTIGNQTYVFNGSGWDVKSFSLNDLSGGTINGVTIIDGGEAAGALVANRDSENANQVRFNVSDTAAGYLGANSDNCLVIGNNTGLPKVSVSNDGNLGIGTNNPLKDLSIESAEPIIRLSDSNATTDTEVVAYQEWYRGNDTNRIGYFGFTSTGNTSINLMNSSGGVSIGALGSYTLSVWSGKLFPTLDSVTSLGASDKRWTTVYATNSSINTSDERLKTFADITETERAVALEIKANMRKFKWTKKLNGDNPEDARWHFGAGAQTVRDIFEKHGLNGFDYGILCYDEWDEYEQTINDKEETETVPAGNIYSLRYEELMAFIISAL